MNARLRELGALSFDTHMLVDTSDGYVARFRDRAAASTFAAECGGAMTAMDTEDIGR